MSNLVEVKVPDIGDFKDIPVIELLVKAGDIVKKDDSLVTLESDKATMEVPAPQAGVVKDIKVKLGDKVSEGSLILLMEAGASTAPSPQPAASTPVPSPSKGESQDGGAATAAAQSARASIGTPAQGPASTGLPGQAASNTSTGAAFTASASAKSEGWGAGDDAPSLPSIPADADFRKPHASPSVRAFARELGVNLTLVGGSGPKGRILKDDVQNFVKAALAGGASPVVARASGGGFSDLGLPAWPKVDFAKFGPVEVVPMSRIKKISGPALARNWVMIPHVTQFDKADITDLEALRQKLNDENAKAGVKLSPLAFIIKACVAALKKYPEFNSSLNETNDALVMKQYYHIGFAADTPNGLVVPVIKDADKKGVIEIAKETGELAAKARDGKLGPADMQGGCFSISSLGGIGGTAFTPIVNAPEVAILGVSKSSMEPVWDGKQFVPRLMMPLSLSYDHRVIDGALAARFTTYLASLLADMRRALL